MIKYKGITVRVSDFGSLWLFIARGMHPQFY